MATPRIPTPHTPQPRTSAHPTVLVVGAGPAGLTAALELKRQGCVVRLVEQLTQRLPHSRALGINSRTLNLLQASEVTPRLLEAGRKIEGAQLHWHGRNPVSLPFARARSPHPFMLVLPQSDTEAIIERRLQELGVTVERGTRLEHLQLDNNRVCARLVAATDAAHAAPRASELIEVDYLVAADGAHSTVRKALEVPFLGSTLDAPWSLADVRLQGEFSEHHANIYIGENSFLFALCIRPGVFRVASSSNHVLEELEQRGTVTDVLWRSEFTVHHRLASQLQVGNVALIGDAAHIHSPLGARGMNLGIEDAALLARRLTDRQWQRYARERLPQVRRVVRRIRRQTDAILGRGVAKHWGRFAPTLCRLPWVQRRLAESLLGIS